jgi:hypothetical protein
MIQCTNFAGARSSPASWIATLSQQSAEEARLGDNKIRISGAWRADVTGFGAREPSSRGLALPKFVERGNFSLNNLVIRWLYVQMDHMAGAG